MSRTSFGFTSNRWLLGVEWLRRANRDDPLGQFTTVALYVGPFYFFVRWPKR